MPHPKVKISDDSGNAVGVTDNRLNVNAYLAATPTIDIGDVSLLLGGTAASVNAGTMDAQTLRVTLATDDTHWGTVGTAADVDGTAHGQLQYIGNSLANLTTINSYTNSMQQYLAFALSTTGAQYSEGDGGFLATGVRNDTLASLVSVDHDHAPFQVNATGAVYVDTADGGQLDGVLDTIVTNTTDIPNVIGTTGGTGPTKCVSMGATNLDGTISECTISSGKLLVGATISSTTNTIEVVGDVAENANAAGNPVLIGGRYDTSARTLGNTDVGALALNASGHVLMDIVNGGQLDTIIDTLETTLTDMDTALGAIKGAVYVNDADFNLLSNSGVAVLGYATSNMQINDGDVGVISLTTAGNVRTTTNQAAPDTFVMIDVDNASESLADTIGVFTTCVEIFLQADESNSGYIMVGDSDVADNRGMKLNAGDTLILNGWDTRQYHLWGSATNQNLRCMITKAGL